MPGVKGQKWAADKRKPERKKCTVRLTFETLARAEKAAAKSGLTITKYLESIIESTIL